MKALTIAAYLLMLLSAISAVLFGLSLSGGRGGDGLLLGAALSLLVSSLVVAGIGDALRKIVGLLTDQRTLLKAIVQQKSGKAETGEPRAKLLAPRPRE